jgi:hypothetical protein
MGNKMKYYLLSFQSEYKNTAVIKYKFAVLTTNMEIINLLKCLNPCLVNTVQGTNRIKEGTG